MNGKTPHIVQYQGSKRILARQILNYMPSKFNRLLEPFAGMAAITIAVAKEGRAKHYHINDINEPIVKLLEMAINNPQELVDMYTEKWQEQYNYPGGHIAHFYHVRECFNSGGQSSANMLYLLARCVKGAVRYGKKGNFNQSPDKRRHGTRPQNIAKNVYAISSLLKGKTCFSALDYHDIIDMAKPGDMVYMDPPYQGVSNSQDNRYFTGVDFDDFAKSIETLNRKNINFLISYDGRCGGRKYGSDLPPSLNCRKVLLNAGVSTQATLLGKRRITYEALYVSRNLINLMDRIPVQMDLLEGAI